MTLVYKNVCLVCGEVLELSELETHLNQNYGHAAVEVMMREDATVEKIAINNRMPGAKTQWEDQCQEIQATVVDSDYEHFTVDAKSDNWTSQIRRVKFRPKFPGSPELTISNLDMRFVEGFKVMQVTPEYFEVIFQTKRTSGKIMPSLSFMWEAKINE